MVEPFNIPLSFLFQTQRKDKSLLELLKESIQRMHANDVVFQSARTVNAQELSEYNVDFESKVATMKSFNSGNSRPNEQTFPALLTKPKKGNITFFS